jgi:lipopolysaccharide biosynthesis regulator YciM
MKQSKGNKLSLGKKTISKLHEMDMQQINGGSSYHTFRCHTNSCAPTWNCPPSSGGSGGSGSGSGGGGFYQVALV